MSESSWSTDVIIEQRPPTVVSGLAQISTLGHYIKSVCSLFILWLFPTLVPETPVIRTVLPVRRHRPRPRHHRHASSKRRDEAALEERMKNLFKLELENELKNKALLVRPAKERRMSMPFFSQTPTSESAGNTAIQDRARRVTLPARKMSMTIVHGIASPFVTTQPKVHTCAPRPLDLVESSTPPLPARKMSMSIVHGITSPFVNAQPQVHTCAPAPSPPELEPVVVVVPPVKEKSSRRNLGNLKKRAMKRCIDYFSHKS